MLPLLPFIAGAAVGVAGVMIFKDKRTKTKLIEGKEYITSKYEEGKESVAALTECVKEKVKSKQADAKEEQPSDEPKE